MKIYYLAGPYRSSTPNGIFNNIMEARKVSLKYWKKGLIVLCPHLNCLMFDGELQDQSYLDGDLEILKRCDGIIMMKSYKKSKGSIKELELAIEMGLEIIYD